MKYQVIYADPPWNYGDKMAGHSFSLDHEYPTMTDDALIAMGGGIKEISDKDCALFLWATSPNLPIALKVIEAWGFKYVTVAFCWSKRTSGGKEVANLGRWTMGNVEVCLLAKRGKPQRLVKNIRQLVVAERTRHSAKPEEVRKRIEALMGSVPRIELFARERKEGWDAFGNEVKSDIALG